MLLINTYKSFIAETFQAEPKTLSEIAKHSLYKKPVYIEKSPIIKIRYLPPNIINQI